MKGVNNTIDRLAKAVLNRNSDILRKDYSVKASCSDNLVTRPTIWSHKRDKEWSQSPRRAVRSTMSRTARRNHRHRSGFSSTVKSLRILGFRYHLPSGPANRLACNLWDIRRYQVESFAYKRLRHSILAGCKSCSAIFTPTSGFMHRENCLRSCFSVCLKIYAYSTLEMNSYLGFSKFPAHRIGNNLYQWYVW